MPAMALVKDPPVSAHPLLSCNNSPCPGGGRPIPNAAPRRVARSKLAGAAVRGQVCRVRKGGRGEWLPSLWASFGPGAPLPARSRHYSSAVRVKAGAARQRARWGVFRRVWRSAGVRGERERGQVRLGLYGPVSSERRGSSFKALSPLVPRARTGVSPALPWNALGCVGAGAAALPRRPSLQTHFGWRPAINSELARTRGIRLSN